MRRSLNAKVCTAKYYDGQSETLEDGEFITYGNKTMKQIIAKIESTHDIKIVSVDDVTNKVFVYEMSEDDFAKYGTLVNSYYGRVSRSNKKLNEDQEDK